MDATLPLSYDPGALEAPLYAWWEASGVFHAEADDAGEPFAIVIPPPNVTGSLHVGHALDNAYQDVLIRRARMQGRNTVWLPGMDHAGIATQNVVEKRLAAEGITRHELGRDSFVDRVWAWKAESGGVILGQLRRLGCSCDWDREAFTFDEPRSRAVREVFVSLYEQGLIYRGHRLINWCPRDTSAISDIEVDHTDEPGELAYIRYPEAAGGTGVVVATTRAETMLGDTAVAVHPDDERYRHLVGRTLRLPLMDREIPVVADDHVDPAFGTGAVKVTPAHDPNDFQIGQRHDLDVIDVMDDEARINANGGPYAGLDRFEARTRIKEDLTALGLLERVEERVHSVGHCQRCGTIVEPRLSDQWFVAVRPLAEAAAEAVRSGRTRFVPERNTKPFLDWLENLNDWCISRQIWWGHRIPAFYDETGAISLLREDPAADAGLVQDPDVLDTWFSSALWPFTTLGWPDRSPDLDTWYPTSVLVTGYDINTFWVSRMMLMGLRFMDDVPFRTVVNHGLVRDRHGKKMSKSFGNVIDPLDLIERHGADALRFALLREARPGQDVAVAEEWVEGARRFCNKLFNAAKLVLSRRGDVRPRGELPAALALEDRWILSRLEATRATADEAYDGADPARAAQALYHFTWDDLCDWYLELTKSRDSADVAPVLVEVLDVVLRLLHPITPFLTEALWRALVDADDTTTIVRAAWPASSPERRDAEAEAQFTALQEAVNGLRRFRADHGLSPKVRVRVTAVTTPEGRAVLEPAVAGISRLAGVEALEFAEAEPNGASGRVVIGAGALFVALEGLVDLEGERARLRKELEAALAEVRRAEGKLSNAGFVAKAPAEVVDVERAKVTEWRTAAEALEAQLAALG